MTTINTTLAALNGNDLGRWLRLTGDGGVVRLTSIYHDTGRTEIRFYELGGGEGSTCIVGPDSPIQLLDGCEACDGPILDPATAVCVDPESGAMAHKGCVERELIAAAVDPNERG